MVGGKEKGGVKAKDDTGGTTDVLDTAGAGAPLDTVRASLGTSCCLVWCKE